MVEEKHCCLSSLFWPGILTQYHHSFTQRLCILDSLMLRVWNPSIPSEGISTWRDSKYTAIKGNFDTSLARIQDDGELLLLMDKWRFIYVQHMDHSLEMVVFRRGSCGNLTCACQQNQVSASDVWKLSTSDSWLFLPVTPDPNQIST